MSPKLKHGAWLRALAVFALMLGLAGSFAPPATATSNTVARNASDSGKTAPNGRPLSRKFVARGAKPGVRSAASAGDTLTKPECPRRLMTKCHLAPAAYKQDDPNDLSNYGNYDLAKRPSGGLKDGSGTGLAINEVVIHDTEGSLAATLKEFQDPASYASAHYVIDTDGSIYQVVPTRDVAWHAGNWFTNMHSVGIEHVGHAASGRTDYTPAMYKSSAALVRWLAAKYRIPLDRAHIIGHDNVQAPVAGLVAGMHWDPGPYWNWQLYMQLLGHPVPFPPGASSPLVTIAPNWASNRPPVQDCSSGTCMTLPAQPANFVYLHAAPDDAAPLLSDPALHPDGAAGTTRIEDWSAKAVHGQKFAVAARQGDWLGIYYGGTNPDGTDKIGWFNNSPGALNALPARGTYITPRAGVTSIPVYGRAYPEAGAYAGTQVSVQPVVPLQYTIGAGERYATTRPVRSEYYWARTIDSSLANNHTTVTGGDNYYQIQFNGRVAYLKVSDVRVVRVN